MQPRTDPAKNTPRFFSALPLALSAVVSLVFLAFASKSSFLYPLNDWVDANCFFTVGKAMTHGQTLYADIYEQKGPLLYALYGLCSLVSSGSFFGVYLLEAVALTAFLFCGYKTAALRAGQTAVFAIPILAACALASKSFSHGGSAEELCLPLLAYPVYLFLRCAKDSTFPSGREVLIAGCMAGCVLWIKFTLTGLIIAWFLWALVRPLIRRQWRTAALTAATFAAGLLASTLPFLIYFASRGALFDWFTGYFANNIYIYAPPPPANLAARLLRIVSSTLDALGANWPFGIWIAAGALWVLLKKSLALKLGAALLAAGMAGGLYWGGRSYAYSALILCVLASPGLGVCLRYIELVERPQTGSRRLKILLACACGISALAVFIGNGNTTSPLFLREREETPQFQFAEIMHREMDSPTLLNYGFLDGGFYMAADIVPSVKYFCRLNIDLPEMKSEQERYLREAVTQYVVTRNLTLNSPRYTEIAQAKAPYDVVEYTYRLYRRADLYT